MEQAFTGEVTGWRRPAQYLFAAMTAGEAGISDRQPAA
jgi:hypothetical protein